MFSRYRTQCFFLNEQNRGESDKIFSVYTELFGKISVFAKSIRKKESKLLFNSSCFSLNTIEFIEGKKYRTLTDVQVVKKYDSAKNLFSRTLVNQCFNDISCLIKDEEKDENIWHLIIEFLNQLEKSQELSVYFHFIWKLFFWLGYSPKMDSCVLCSNKKDLDFFSLTEGGLVGRCCSNNGILISSEAKELIQLFSQKNFNQVEISNEQEIKQLSQKYLEYLCSK